MIYGDNENIIGANKIFETIVGFKWNWIQKIISMKFKITYNEHFEEVSCLEIVFAVAYQTNEEMYIKMKFSNISDLQINGLSEYNQIMGFEIVDNSANGWESDYNYYINDYENSLIRFYCKKIEVINVQAV